MTTTRSRFIHQGLTHGWSVQGLDTDTLRFERGAMRLTVLFIGRGDTFVIARLRGGGQTTEITTVDALLTAMASAP